MFSLVPALVVVVAHEHDHDGAELAARARSRARSTFGGRTPSYGQLSVARRAGRRRPRASGRSPRPRIRFALGVVRHRRRRGVAEHASRARRLEPRRRARRPRRARRARSTRRDELPSGRASHARVAGAATAEGRFGGPPDATLTDAVRRERPARRRRSSRRRRRARSSARGAANASCAASTLAGSPPHASSADACSARPYENESGHGPPSWLIALRFSVASTSDWPPERNTIPGTSAGTWRRKLCTVSSRDRLRASACVGQPLPGDHHVRLEQRPAQVDVLLVELGEDRAQRAPGHLVADLDRVVGVHQHLGLDDRHEPGLLAQRRVARRARGRSRGCTRRSGSRRRS